MNEKSSIKISAKAFVSSALILLLLMICAGALTYIVPAGAYERVLIDGKEAVDPDSFYFIKSGAYPVWRWFTAPFEVLVGPDAATVISIIVLNCFFIPMEVHPPRMYPVIPSSSFTCIISTDFSANARAAAFKSISLCICITHT